VLAVRKDEEADAEDAIDLRTQVLEVHFGDVLNLKLHARRDEYLLGAQVQHAIALLKLLDLFLSSQLSIFLG
jgi:hypothetical protein